LNLYYLGDIAHENVLEEYFFLRFEIIYSILLFLYNILLAY